MGSPIHGPHVSQNSIIPIYTASSPTYPRTFPINQHPMTSGKSIYPETWTSVPYTGDFPVESYEGFSPLSMALSHSTLPVALNDRQLPIPQSTRSQFTTTAVDQLHMRSLLSLQGINSTNINSNGTYTKAAMAWSNEGSAMEGRPSSITGSLLGEIAASTPPKSYGSVTMPEGVLGYIPVTATSNSEPSPTSTTPSFIYNTVSKPMLASIIGNGYLNFQHHSFPHGSSSEGLLSRHGSSSNLYSPTDSSSKRNSLGEISPTEGTLVGGQRYAPLCQPQPQHASSADALRRDSFDQRSAPTHHSLASSLNCNF